jgi:hypothetical protein
MCCSTGICGPEIDPSLVAFAALLAQLHRGGVKVERHNLGQQPMEFVRNPAVKTLLDTEGVDALPVVFVDGEIRFKGRYPDDAERAEFARAVPARTIGLVS